VDLAISFLKSQSYLSAPPLLSIAALLFMRTLVHCHRRLGQPAPPGASSAIPYLCTSHTYLARGLPPVVRKSILFPQALYTNPASHCPPPTPATTPHAMRASMVMPGCWGHWLAALASLHAPHCPPGRPPQGSLSTARRRWSRQRPGQPPPCHPPHLRPWTATHALPAPPCTLRSLSLRAPVCWRRLPRKGLAVWATFGAG
jgi:hypothetical protein